MKVPFLYQIHKISIVCPILLWANPLRLALATVFFTFLNQRTNFHHKLLSHLKYASTRTVQSRLSLTVIFFKWMKFSYYPDSNQLRGQTNWCDISKDGHHQFFTCMYMCASPSLRDRVYFLSLWVGPNLWLL